MNRIINKGHNYNKGTKMRIIDVFKKTTEEERRRVVTEILIKIENDRQRREKNLAGF